MATTRALSLALLLAFCFAACACTGAAVERQPRNRYVSYAAPRGEYDAGHGGIRPWPLRPGCSAYTGRCPSSRRAPTEAGATTAAAGSKGDHMSHHAALPGDGKHPAPVTAGAKKGAAGTKGRYISRDALSADNLCGVLGCPPPRP